VELRIPKVRKGSYFGRAEEGGVPRALGMKSEATKHDRPAKSADRRGFAARRWADRRRETE
jgi:hypothetical protein